MDACLPALPWWTEIVGILSGGLLLAAPYVTWRWGHLTGFRDAVRLAQVQNARRSRDA